MTEQDNKILDLISAAKKASLKDVLEKVRAGKPLTAEERRFLLQYEADIREQRDQEPHEQTPGAFEGRTELESPLEVTSYLKAAGWKVSKSTLYQHVKQGKLRPDADGRFPVKAVQKYAASFLTLEETRQKVADEDLQRKKLIAEISRIQEQTKRERIKRLAEEGRYVPRDQFEMELAARASVIDTLRRNSIMTGAAERVALVGGDTSRIPDLIAFDLAQHDDEMNQFATTIEFHVLFEQTTSPQDSQE